MIVGPKIEDDSKTGVEYHAKERISAEGKIEWAFHENECPLKPANMLLVRILIGKVKDRNRLARILNQTPIRQGQAGWNCVSWVKEALERVKTDGKALGTSVIDWEPVRSEAMRYCQDKKDQHRFDGQRDFDMSKAPTYDLIRKREIVL